jgi:hypothetical protein
MAAIQLNNKLNLIAWQALKIIKKQNLIKNHDPN